MDTLNSWFREPAFKKEDQMTSFSSKYRISEEVIDKYSKSHIFEVKTAQQFQDKVIDNEYPVVVLCYEK